MITALTIGNFDGVHLGHIALVKRCRAVAGADGRVVVLTFDPHPLTLLRPAASPARLTTFSQRSEVLKAAGADEVHALTPSQEFLALEPDEFIDQVLQQYSPSYIIEGDDFHFGRGGRGNNRTLAILSSREGFKDYTPEVVSPIEVTLADHNIVRCSSSALRYLISNGRTVDASTILGRPYEVVGTVTKGDQRGRTIGFPTVNIDTQCMMPADGVYAANLTTPDGLQLTAAVNVGSRPTFSGIQRRIEAHAIGQQLPFDYGWAAKLAFGAFLRDQIRFDSVERLKSQLARDCQRVISACGN